MKDAPRYLLERWRVELDALFDESEREDVLDWLIANHDRKRVILVGSGFSRNAKNPRSISIPLWMDISKALADDLRVGHDAFDALSLADFHRRNQGESAFQNRLLSLLDDSAIEPGEAHAALWASGPEAVITTNFLDTLLERNPHALSVIEDPDLALPVGETRAQVIYLHGHRSNFQSWVAGRSDYDDLQEKRPMLFARTRQLFAQFPLLVVGYSLTDPDFHLLYRQMVRAMNRRHPMGLAVVFQRSGDSAVQEERAAKKYWEDLGLRIVRFRVGGELSSEQRFVRFFSLTKRLNDRKDLERSYVVSQNEGDIAVTFHANVEIMESAFQDTSLDRIWLSTFDARASFWQTALKKALPKTLVDAADDKAQKFNLARFHRPTTADGSSTAQPEQAAAPNQSEELIQSLWVDSRSPATQVDRIWELLSDQRGNAFVWNLDTLLGSATERSVVATWLRAAIRPDILDEHHVDVLIVSCALLLLGGWQADDVQVLHELASPRDPRVAEALGPTDGTIAAAEPLVVLLGRARSALEAGDQTEARVSYSEAVATAPSCPHRERPLLTYFALEGYANSLASRDFSNEARAKLNDAYDRARQARDDPQVRQWWERVNKFKTALRKSKIEQQEQEISRSGYETRSMSWSSSGRHLYLLLRDAIRLGAPLSVQRELTEPLLGSFPDDYIELEERLRLNLAKPGEWLARRLLNGDLFRARSTGLFPDDMQAGAVDRRSGVEKASESLFPRPKAGSKDAGATDTLVSQPTRLAPRLGATLQVLEEAGEVLLAADIPRALETITLARRIGDDAVVVEAAAGVSHVCEWLRVRELLLELSRSAAIRDLRRCAQHFPWAHWTVCDDFLRDQEHGADLLRELASDAPPFDRMFVGWALRSVLANAPDNDELVNMCAEFARKAIREKEEDAHMRDSDREQIAALAAISARFCDQAPDVVRWLTELLENNDDLARGILLQSPLESPLRAEARKSLLRSAPSRGTIHERVTLATLEESQRPIEWEQVHEELTKSWKGLSDLAPVLRTRYWTAHGWQALGDVLRIGGHRGKTASWRLQRVKLVIDALDDDESSQTIFDDSQFGMGFLRSAIVDAVASGDGILANNAVYGLTALARRTEKEVDAAAVAAALRAAADDVRIGVAHGAAFVAHYLLAYRAIHHVHPQVIEVAEEVGRLMSADPLAIVQRQAEFGSKQGTRDAAKRAAADNNH